jgi:phosphocarrier protein HPr
MDMADADLRQAERASGNAVVRDPTGLHARPAVRLTKLAKQFDAAVWIRSDSSDGWINAKSPNRVMKLKARHGETISFVAEGADAAAAVRELVALVERNFDA